MKTSFAEILARQAKTRALKIEDKLPVWAGSEGLTYLTDLSLEQCSSEKTALFKASVAAGLFQRSSEKLLWDMTGGLGVDAWAFSRCFGKVIYNEHNALLADAAKKNFAALGANNIEVFSTEAEDFALPGSPDIIFLDPARRDDAGRKVFLVEDCRPDVLSMLPSLFRKAPVIMVKLSPMADISMLSSRFGDSLRRIYVVGHKGECKELLCVLDRSGDGFSIVVKELYDNSEFVYEPSIQAVPSFANAEIGDWLWEPCAPLMKSGCFNLISERFGIAALAPSTHLFISSEPCGCALFKSFLVVDIFDFGRAGFRDAGMKYPRADVSARNVPMSSEELRKRLGVKSGNDYHIFACSTRSGRCLFVTKCSHHCVSSQSEQ